MIAVVYSTPRDGPAQVWLLSATDDGSEPPDTASIPGGAGPGALVFSKFKGTSLPWLEWGQELTEAPWLGDWSIAEVPDTDGLGQPMTAQAALGTIRMRTLERSIGE